MYAEVWGLLRSRVPPPPGICPRPSMAEMTEMAGVRTPSPMIMPTPSTHSVLTRICRKRLCTQRNTGHSVHFCKGDWIKDHTCDVQLHSTLLEPDAVNGSRLAK